MIDMTAPQVHPVRPPRIFAFILLLLGACLLVGGGLLALLDGSPYYVIAGLALLVSAILLWRGRRAGAWLYLLMLIGTWGWALWEVGLDGWQLMPRVLLWTILGLWLLTPWVRHRLT
ncbi:hypothetical protein [Emcibacter sp. SYSU 3D8]|uniref:hypothetical protein n=1 Tax=Emcibacter sp. SYSU 3D8 TaxID=3133969 RepID=UPI0031FF1523